MAVSVEEHESFALWEGELRRHARLRTVKSAARALLEGMVLVGGYYCPTLAAGEAHRPGARQGAPGRR